MKPRRLMGFLTLPLLAGTGHAEAVREAAVEVPVAAEVDVAIAGGTSGAVAAAVAAAGEGAKVFLCAPRPYLGEDMTATLRTWLEADEQPVHPLAKALFADKENEVGGPDPNRLEFTYTTDVPSAAAHADTRPPSRLCDGNWAKATTESVQYDDNVEVTIDLGEAQAIERVRLMAFHQDSPDERRAFKVRQMTVLAEEGLGTWREVARVTNANPSEGLAELVAPFSVSARQLKLFIEKDDTADRMLLGEIEVVKKGPRPETGRQRPAPRPLHVKMTLDRALLDAGVQFLYSCYPTELIVDAKGRPSGFVIANRAGRQAVLAKTLIDATDMGVLARLAGAEFRKAAPGERTFKRTVIGGEFPAREGAQHRFVEPAYVGRHSPEKQAISEYTLLLPVADGGWRARAAADQRARDLTFHTGQEAAAEWLFENAPEAIRGTQPPDKRDTRTTDLDDAPLGAFQPKGAAGLFVLGPRADLGAELAARLARPHNLIPVGERIGKAAAAEARKSPAPDKPRVRPPAIGAATAAGDVREFLEGARPIEKGRTIPQEASALPVLGRYDVVVVGGGTSGAPAAIGAARRGAKTLLIEYQYMLGGVGTTGLISKYYWGNRVGFTATIPGEREWHPDDKAEWYRVEARKAGADIWMGATGCGAVIDKSRVTGVVVATPWGRGAVLGRVVIDTTGNADIAAAAGARVIYTDETELAVQGTGLPPRWLGKDYTNTDFTIVDETDMLDTWHVFLYSKQKYSAAFDQMPFIDTRERRRVVGDFTITLRDQLLNRTHPDTLFRAYSNFDTHGFTTDPLLEVKHPEKVGCYVNVPYRCSLPAGLDGILVGGLGLSAHRDALPLVRMQPDLQNQGYGLGVAAALVASSEGGTRDIVVKELQKHLVEIGNLPPETIEEKDNFPLPPERIAAAAQAIAANLATPETAAVLLAHADAAKPEVRKAFAAASDPEGRIACAQMLAILGDNTGLDVLLEAVKARPTWDEGWRYRGGGQFGHALSRLDQLVIALGRSRDRRALPAIFEKAGLLDAASEFSHHRAVGLALELIRDPAAAPPLAELLRKPGVMGHVHDTVEKAAAADAASTGGTASVATRSDSIRELALARALYRCGDHDGLGKEILTAYTRDLRGHFARHAKAVLEGK